MSDSHSDHGDRGSRFIQHHYDDAKHQFDSGKLGIWLFLVQEILFFSGLFVAYILYRNHRPEIFAYAHYYLDVKWGAINTAVLIVSSLSAAWAVRCAQLEQRKGLIAALSITLICACAFLGIKYIEYTHKIHEHILFGKKFDPCITPSGDPLLNKGNKCAGHKTSVVWDYAAKKPAAGCLAGNIDRDRATPGIQAQCRVEEVSFTRAGKAWNEKSRRDLPACSFGSKVDAHGAREPDNAPCWTLAENPLICREGPGAIAWYGDHAIRGDEVQIAASCEAAPPALSPADAFAPPVHPETVGAGIVSPTPPPTKHQLGIAMSQGPPPENTNMFFSIYFAMTGLHGIHVLAGVFVFIWLLVRAVKGHFNRNYFGPVDYAALYWHLVDLIWIFLFPMLYLIH